MEGIEGIEKFGKILIGLPINSTNSLESKRCSTPFSTVHASVSASEHRNLLRLMLTTLLLTLCIRYDNLLAFLMPLSHPQDRLPRRNLMAK